MPHNSLEHYRTDDKTLVMHFTILNGIILSRNWAKIVKFLNYFSLFFQKTRIKDCFKFPILDFDQCLNRPTITNAGKIFIPEGYQHSSCN